VKSPYLAPKKKVIDLRDRSTGKTLSLNIICLKCGGELKICSDPEYLRAINAADLRCDTCQTKYTIFIESERFYIHIPRSNLRKKIHRIGRKIACIISWISGELENLVIRLLCYDEHAPHWKEIRNDPNNS